LSRPGLCPSARRLLRQPMQHPVKPVVEVIIGSSQEPLASVGRTLRGRPVITIRAPLRWLEAPPGRDELRLILCCAPDTWIYSLAAQLSSVIVTLASIALFASSLVEPDGVAASVVGGIIGAIVGLLGALHVTGHTVRGRFERCLASTRRLAGLAVHGFLYTPLADLVSAVIASGRACTARSCRDTISSMLGPYRVTLRHGRLIYIKARPLGRAG
jgi:hypothetical protein